MKNKKSFSLFLSLTLILITLSTTYPQNPEWINYTNGDCVYSLALEGNFVWIGTNGGLVKLDKTTGEKTFCNRANSGLPYNEVWSLAIDASGNNWIGTEWCGLAKYDGTNWTVYNTSNSGLPDDYVPSLAIDASGNKWIGTGGGLAVYHEGGFVSVKEQLSAEIPAEYLLSQNYPNPFNPITTISYDLPYSSRVLLSVYDINGRLVEKLVDEQQTSGYYSVQWNASRYSSGVYFYKLETDEFKEIKKCMLVK